MGSLWCLFGTCRSASFSPGGSCSVRWWHGAVWGMVRDRRCNGLGASLAEEAPVSAENTPTLSCNKVSPMWSNLCDGTIDVPQFGTWVLHCDAVPNLKSRQVTRMLVVERLCLVLC